MAQTIPVKLPSKASQGEQRMFAALKRLPDDVVVYYEPIIDNLRPDFVVILPTLGVLLIEVKGWRFVDILAGSNRNTVRVREGSLEVENAHPLRQVEKYQWRLVDRCKKDKQISEMVNLSGPYCGKFQFPFASFAVLSNITRMEINKWPERSREVFPSATVATRDQLLSWGKLEGMEFLDVLSQFFKPYFSLGRTIERMTDNQINIVKAILHPEILIGLRFDNAEQPKEPSVMVLDAKQESLARDISEGHRLIFGVAGSGKTVLLVARAKLIASLSPSSRVLVLCYNVTFGTYLAETLRDFTQKTVRVMTFHSWAARNGVRWNADEVDSVVGERLLSNLKAGALDSKRYDTVLIDEAQDFDSTWYPCVLEAMKDPVDGDLLIVGDGSQGLYKRRKVSWKQLGIQASGRTQYLHRNYRNTRPIVALATRFASKSVETNEDGLSAPQVDPDQCVRLTGAETVLLRKKSKSDEVDRVVRVVGDLLAGKWFGDPIAPLRPEQIAILYRMDHGLIGSLCQKIKSEHRKCPVIWLNEPDKNAKGRIGEPGVKILTMHSAKGLQFKAVILIFANDCPVDFGNATEEEERCLFYVALTRAEDYLAISSSGKSAFITEIEAAGAPPTERGSKEI